MAFNSGNNFDGRLAAAQNSYVKTLAAPPSTAEETLGEEEIVTAKEKRKKKTRSLVDIDLNALPNGDSPAAAGSGGGKLIDRGGVAENERRRRRWAALLDAAAIAVIREYEGNLEREDMEYRAENRMRNPRKSGGGGGFQSWLSGGGGRRRDMGGACGYDVGALAAAPPLVHRSKRGRIVALPNRYKDSAPEAAAAVEEEEEEEEAEFPRWRKSPAAIVAADRKSRWSYTSRE